MNPPQSGYSQYNHAQMPAMEGQKSTFSAKGSHTGATVTNTGLPRIRSWYHPHTWKTRTRAIVTIVALVIVVAIIIGVYEGIQINRYPDYSRLNYSLTDTFQGTNFFDNFNYFTGTDPAEGFVV